MLGRAAQVVLTSAAISLAVARPSVHASHHPPQPALSSDFSLEQTRLQLTGRCEPTFVARRIARMLGSFNVGRPYYFVAPFSAQTNFHPYNGTREAFASRTPEAIASFVRMRHRAGDGWTALALIPPSGSAGATAIYGLRLRVVKGLAEPYTQGVKLVVVCSSGRIKRWLGPAAPAAPPR